MHVFPTKTSHILHNLEERYELVQQTILNDLLIVQDKVNATNSNLPTCECTFIKSKMNKTVSRIIWLS